MERKIATRLTDKVKTFVAKKLDSDFYNNNNSGCLFHHPNFNDYKGFLEGHHVDVLISGYELVSEQEFLDYFKEDKIADIKLFEENIKAMEEQYNPIKFENPKHVPYTGKVWEPNEITFEKPIHYAQTKSGMDVFDVARDWNIKDPELFSALKYILRCGKKDSESMEVTKAINCLTKYLKVLDNE